VEWCRDPGETISTRVPKANVIGLQNCLWDKLPTWANNGSCVEEKLNNFKDVDLEGMERFVTHKILKQNPDPEN
jgi:hypothetical protein